MKEIMFVIYFVTYLFGQAPIITTYPELPEDRNGEIYVAMDVGVCLDAEGNGQAVTQGTKVEENYISYEGTLAECGDVVYTAFVMNPDPQACNEEILYRFDYIEGKGYTLESFETDFVYKEVFESVQND